MDILRYWLHAGIASILLLTIPQIWLDDDNIAMNIQVQQVLTSEMEQLVSGGIPLDFELYCSGKFTGNQQGMQKTVIHRIKRSIKYNYLNDCYIVSEGKTELAKTTSLKKAEHILCQYKNIQLQTPKDWISVNIFVELSSLGNSLLTEKFSRSGASLWNGYKPTATITVDRNQLEQKRNITLSAKEKKKI